MTHELSDRYDSPWKQIIERHFRAFLAFYFREVHDGLDWRVKPVFLEKELQQIRPDHTEGKKIVDKLVKVCLLEGREVWLYIHIEIQVDKDGTFTQRVFVYKPPLRQVRSRGDQLGRFGRRRPRVVTRHVRLRPVRKPDLDHFPDRQADGLR